MSSVIELTVVDTMLALSLVAASVVVSLRLGLRLERSLLWATLRTIVQLLAVGYLVTAIFSVRTPWAVLAFLLVMLAVAGWIALSRQPWGRRALYPMTVGSLALGAGVTLVFTMVAVVQPAPWYDPRYLIPLGGIILGNAMNAAALGLERLDRELTQSAARVEAVLALGGTPEQASADAERSAVRAALIPIINSMMAVGLVQLPGVMTGQILAGVDPLVAVRYQMLVLFMLLAGNALTTGLAVRGARGRYFNTSWQLELPR